MRCILASAIAPALVATASLIAGVVTARVARADEIYATVERTAAPGERARVHVRADAAGPVTVLAYRVEATSILFFADVDPQDGAALASGLSRSLDRARSAAGDRIPIRPATKTADDAPHTRADGIQLTFVARATATLAVTPGNAIPGDERGPALPEAYVEVPLPASGLYVMEAFLSERNSTVAVVSALVSRLAVVTKRDPTGILAFAVDRRTGQAIEGATVEAYASSSGRMPLATVRTDGKGLARLLSTGAPFPPKAEVRASLGDDLAFGSETYFPADVPDRRVYAFTHQPAYRPGERVELKGIVRAWHDGVYSLDADVAEVSLHFLDCRGTEIGTTKAAVAADMGTFAAGLDLPATVPTGDARAIVTIGEGTPAAKSYEAPFRIEAYRKPTFEVTAESKPARVLAGGDFQFTIRGQFFEGGPLAGAEVGWTLSYHRVDRDLFPADEMARLFFGTERDAFAAEDVAKDTGRLDANGELIVRVKAPVKADDGFLTLQVIATGPDRTTARGSGTAAFSATPLTVALKTDKHLYGTEATAHVTVKALLADGLPAAGRRGVLTAALVTDVVADGGRRVHEEAEAGSFALTTGPDGTAVLDVPLARNGRYAVSVAISRLDAEPAGPPAHAVTHCWVVGDRADLGFSGDRIEVVADKDEYAVGDKARFLVLSPAGSRPFLSTVEGAQILSFDTVALGGAGKGGAAAVVELAITETHSPNAYLGVALVDEGNVLATEKLIRVPPAAKLLRPTVVAQKTEMEPGETVGMTAHVVDATGQAVPNAEVAVAVVDDALYALFSDPSAPIAPFFHPVRRNDVRTGGPMQFESVGWAVAAPPRKEMERHGAPGAEDGGGGRSAPASGAAPPPTTAAPPAPSPAGPPPAEAPRPGALALPEAAGAEGRRSRADGFLLASGDGAETFEYRSFKLRGKDGGDGPLEPRKDFRSAIAWSPTLRTGADGSVALPPTRMGDSITRWRITAVAVDARTRVGSSTTTVRTAKRVLTRVTLPRFLRATDVVLAPWVLHSLLPTDAEATFHVGATGLEIKGPSSGKETLKAGAVVTHDLSMTAPRVGEGRVNAELRTDAGGDAMLATLPILPQGIPKSLLAAASIEKGTVSLDPLSLPPTAEKGTARLRITVTPSVAQAVGAALPYLADYPYGCTEQTMSRLVPVVVAKAAQDQFHIPLRGRLAELPKMIDAGIARLRALQHDDGGFGWWPNDASDPYMTAYVAHGLTRTIPVMKDPAPAQEMLSRATKWLNVWLAASAKLELSGDASRRSGIVAAFAQMALADAGALDKGVNLHLPDDGVAVVDPLERAFILRALLSRDRDMPRARHQIQILAGHAIRDASGTHWGGTRGDRSRWDGDPVETTAWVLGAILSVDPAHPDVAPGVRWLLAQRSGGDHWHSTRDTAACVAFLTRYAVATNDLGAGREVTVAVNDRPLPPITVTAENAFTDATSIEVPTAGLPSGDIRVTATSTGSTSVSALLSFTDTGPAVAAASAGFDVKRTWWLLESTTVDGKPVLRRKPVTETVPSGALLDVEVTVTTDTTREFAMIESPHAAGFEPERDYGAAYADALTPASHADHVETYDDRTVFFAKDLPRGTHVFRHRVRAVHAGSFTALPASASLMYFPDVRGNGAGEVLEISKAGAAGSDAKGGK